VVTAKDSNRQIGIAIGKTAEMPFWEGTLTINNRSNTWIYPKVNCFEHRETTKRHFRFGICQAGFGYFVTQATLEPNGRLVIGSGAYDPQ
jgi:hypothetical protein